MHTAELSGYWRRLRFAAERAAEVGWMAGSRCIILDFTFFYTWSRLLTCVSFLTIALKVLDHTFDYVLPIESCERCKEARQVGVCDGNGVNGNHMPNADEGMEVSVDPFGETTIELDFEAVQLILLFIAVSTANSRYLKGVPGLSLLIVPAAAGLCVWHAAGRLSDLTYCGRSESIDWQPYAPQGVTYFAPPDDVRRTAEYCQAYETPRMRQSLGPSMLETAKQNEAVKRIWAAWMDGATFSVSLSSGREFVEYCRLVKPALGTSCIAWLNTSFGNRVSCTRLISSGSGDGWDATLEAAGRLDVSCVARVRGPNFALRIGTVGTHDPDRLNGIAFHLLVLAEKGEKCLSSCDIDGSRVVAEARELRRRRRGFDDAFGVPAAAGPLPADGGDGVTTLPLPFFRCVVTELKGCLALEGGSSRTVFRSTGASALALATIAAYAWMVYRRYTTKLWRPWRRWSPGLAQAVHVALASRVILGLIITLWLQLSYFSLIIGMRSRLHSLLELRVCSRSSSEVQAVFGVPCSLIEMMAPLLCLLQCAIVIVAVVVNVRQYYALRSQVMALPKGAFFGEDPAPAFYCGPDLEDLKEMASSSVLYAAYFPGIVFWRFFFASGLLATLAVVLLTLFLLVFEVHFPHAAGLWRVLSSLIFVSSILSSHFLTRIFLQSCILQQSEHGMRSAALAPPLPPPSPRPHFHAHSRRRPQLPVPLPVCLVGTYELHARHGAGPVCCPVRLPQGGRVDGGIVADPAEAQLHPVRRAERLRVLHLLRLPLP